MKRITPSFQNESVPELSSSNRYFMFALRSSALVLQRWWCISWALHATAASHPASIRSRTADVYRSVHSWLMTQIRPNCRLRYCRVCIERRLSISLCLCSAFILPPSLLSMNGGWPFLSIFVQIAHLRWKILSSGLSLCGCDRAVSFTHHV